MKILKKFIEPRHTGGALSTLKIQHVHTKLLQKKYLKVSMKYTDSHQPSS